MPNDPIKTCGYHGTLMDRAENIRVNGFNKSDKSIEWLGFGIYFFDSFINAKQWAIQEAERQERSSGEPAVLVVNIKVRSCDFLDLDKRSVKAAFMRCLEDGYKLMFSDTSGGAPNFRDDRELRCFWCNYYTKTHPNIKVIALTFPRIHCNRFGFPSVYGKRQLCVVDSSCIEMPPSRLEAV